MMKKYLLLLTPKRSQNWVAGRAKAPGFDDRKASCIANTARFAIDRTAGAFASAFGLILGSLWCTLPWSLAFAIEPEMRVSILEAQMNEATVRTVHGNYGAKTATACPPILGENWFFTGDMLWWHADAGGTDYAQLFKTLPDTASENSVRNRRLKFKWNFGFRAGIGTIFAHDKWDLYLNFTWFRQGNSSASSLHSGTFLSPLAPIPPLEASQVKTHWNLHFYTLDLTLGRSFFVSPKLAFRPYLGAKTGWISQHIRGKSAVFLPAPMELKTKQRNAFWGIGPAGGIEGKWFLDYGFNIFASGGGALLWGDFDIRHNQNPGPHYNLNIRQIAPTTQMQLGLSYETNIHHDVYRVSLSCRYEYQYWWGQNLLPAFSSQAGARFQRYVEDLSLQGITVDARFDF